MIKSFGDKETRTIFDGFYSLEFPFEIQRAARRKLRILDKIVLLAELKIPSGNRLEKLQGDLANYYSIRINDKYRIIFIWNEEGDAYEVRIIDYH